MSELVYDEGFSQLNDKSDIELDMKTNKGHMIQIPPSVIPFPDHYKMEMTALPKVNCDPGPLGLFSLCVGCCILIAADFGLTAESGILLRAPWLFMIPGIAQLTAGILEVFRKNVFGSFAFVIYGAFWCGLGWTYLQILYGGVDDSKKEMQHFGVICIGYLIFSIILFIGSLGLNVTFPIILGFISFALFMLIIHIFTGMTAIPSAIGLIVVAVAAAYTGYAIMLNTYAERTVLNVGGPIHKWVPKKTEEN
ncbi:inner membrane protein yaah [Anaeramoeba flamelloides]|uniref:Inner membrane protein yaah n=1 Tax=Anaeramoeba flamelloides TaxID=1746091 RepID=A0AAV7YYC6_9EUKA|nr:inner membrane protein yaah [Anaeramoeba flamelloides]KAJ6242216.1 inner membrane protein yaah [Anaeramoeba flamelloides]